jgi:hypothetical protein
MSIYRVLVEWTDEGKRREGLIFFEAESLEKARAETQKIVDRMLFRVQEKQITAEAESCDPEFLVMWGKAEIARVIQPNSAKMTPLVQTQPQPQPSCTANVSRFIPEHHTASSETATSRRAAVVSIPDHNPQNPQGCFQSFSPLLRCEDLCTMRSRRYSDAKRDVPT